MKKFKLIVSLVVVVLLLMGTGFSLQGAEKSGKQSSSSAAAKININTADVSGLIKLPRIGEKTAERIIQYRKKNGNFKRIQDVMKVKGIGEKTFNKFKDKITV